MPVLLLTSTFIITFKNCVSRTLCKTQVIIYVFTFIFFLVSTLLLFIEISFIDIVFGFCLLCHDKKMTVEIRKEKSCSLPNTKYFEDTRIMDNKSQSGLIIIDSDSLRKSRQERGRVKKKQEYKKTKPKMNCTQPQTYQKVQV